MIIDDRMSTDVEIKSNDGCTPRNALFCCHSPVCLNGPKILPIDYQTTRQPDVIPVSVPDLTKLGMMNANQRDSKKAEAQSTEAASTGGKVASAQDVRLGVVLRRVTPPRKTVMVKKSDPLMGVVLRKVEKHSLAIPKPRPAERSPPPKKASAKVQPVVEKACPKPLIAPAVVIPPVVVTPAPKPPPPVNLLLNRPPLEIHRIEGDKIIIIRRIPKANPPAGQEKTQTHSGHGKHSDNSKTHSGHKSHKHHSGHGKLKPSASGVLTNGSSTSTNRSAIQVTISLCILCLVYLFVGWIDILVHCLLSFVFNRKLNSFVANIYTH